MWSLLSAPALATTWLVPSQVPTIGAAVGVASSGDTILVDASQPFYHESVVVDRSLTIVGVYGQPRLIPQDYTDGFFHVDGAGVQVTVRNVWLDGQIRKRAVYVADGEVLLDRVTIRNIGEQGGAVYAEGNADRVTLTGCTVEEPYAAGAQGGAIAVLGGDLVLSGTSFLSTSSQKQIPSAIATDGGFVHMQGPGALVVQDCSFRGGVASNNGGALHLRNTGGIEVRNSTFVDNLAMSSTRGGGAVYLEGTRTHTFAANTFRENTTFHLNAEGGGAVYQRNGSGTFSGNVWCLQDTFGQGGALRIHDGPVTITRDVFLENHAGGNGGAIWVANAGAVNADLQHLTFAGNTANLGQAVAADKDTDLVDSFFTAHAVSPAVHAVGAGDAAVATSGWWRNVGGDWNNNTTDLTPAAQVTTDPLLGPLTPGACDPEQLRPPANSPLVGRASDGTTIGALEGGLRDADGDGVVEGNDCDDTDRDVYPGAPEQVGDGVDQDCDGTDTVACHEDLDRDGYGSVAPVDAPDGTCDTEDGEADDDLDCDDLSDAVNPDATEVVNGVDDDCDGDTDFEEAHTGDTGTGPGTGTGTGTGGTGTGAGTGTGTGGPTDGPEDTGTTAGTLTAGAGGDPGCGCGGLAPSVPWAPLLLVLARRRRRGSPPDPFSPASGEKAGMRG